MPTAKSNRIELCYETFGDRANPAMLLAMGLGLELLHWPVGFSSARARFRNTGPR